jgi:hypothetical protein
MIRFLGILVLAFCATLSLTAQPRFLWTKLGKGPSFDEARAIAVAPQGDVRIAGVYSDSIVIGDQTCIWPGLQSRVDSCCPIPTAA